MGAPGRVAMDHPLGPGTTLFLGRNRRHMPVNDGYEEMQGIRPPGPNGRKDVFRGIGRPREPGETAPAPFPGPDDVLEIERRTVFAPPPTGPCQS